MDIQNPSTPRNKKRDPYSTPPHSNKQINQEQEKYSPRFAPCQTPPSKKNVFETPTKGSYQQDGSSKAQIRIISGFKPKENPQSKKHKHSPFNLKPSPFKYSPCPKFEITPFYLTRLEQDYNLVQTLGRGHFSQVGLYQSKMTGEAVAIKTAKANRMSVNEVQALGSLWVLSGQCPNVVRYYHSWVEDGQLYLVMEYCEDSLQKHIAKYRNCGTPMPQKLIINYLRAALLGLASIHKHGILHLDVKPENMLFKGNTLKIADFGLSRAAQIRNGDVEEGDSRYLAKEVLNLDSKVDLTKADIFSLGMTAYEMLTLELLPNNGEQWLHMRETGIKVESRMDLTGYSDGLLRVVEKMGAARWQDRPSAVDLLKNSLFKQSNRFILMSNGKSGKKRQQSSL